MKATIESRWTYSPYLGCLPALTLLHFTLGTLGSSCSATELACLPAWPHWKQLLLISCGLTGTRTPSGVTCPHICLSCSCRIGLPLGTAHSRCETSFRYSICASQTLIRNILREQSKASDCADSDTNLANLEHHDLKWLLYSNSTAPDRLPTSHGRCLG